MVTLWDKRSNVQFHSPQFPVVYISSVAPPEPDIGLFHVLLGFGQALPVQRRSKLIVDGNVHQIMFGSTESPAVSVIAQSRSVMRFTFSGTFRRVN